MVRNPHYTMSVSNLCACLRDHRVPLPESDKQLDEWLAALDRDAAAIDPVVLAEVYGHLC